MNYTTSKEYNNTSTSVDKLLVKKNIIFKNKNNNHYPIDEKLRKECEEYVKNYYKLFEFDYKKHEGIFLDNNLLSANDYSIDRYKTKKENNYEIKTDRCDELSLFSNFHRIIKIKNNNNNKSHILLTELSELELKNIDELLKLFNYSYEFISLDKEIRSEIKKSKNKLLNINYLTNNGEIKIVNENDIENEILEICTFINKYIILFDNKNNKDGDGDGDGDLNFNKYAKKYCNFNYKLNEINNKVQNRELLCYNSFDSIYLNYEKYDKSNIFDINLYSSEKNIIIFYNNITNEFVIKNKEINLGSHYNTEMILKKMNIDIIFVNFNKDIDIVELKSKLTQEKCNSFDEMIEIIESNIDDITNISSITHLKNIIKEIYKISDDKNKLIQFTDIYDEIINIIGEDKCNDDNKKEIKYILPYVLNEIGLKKKRTSKGMMWYGLEKNEIGLKKKRTSKGMMWYGLENNLVSLIDIENKLKFSLDQV